MAKSISPNFKFQGTVGVITFVNSPTYGHHPRAARGTNTEIVVTDSMQKAVDNMNLCNQQAQPVYAALKSEYHDGRLWSRLLSLFQKEQKAGRKISVERLLHLECNITYKLENILPHQYKIAVRKDQKKLQVTVDLPKHPKVEDTLPRQGYKLRVVVLYPDFNKMTCRKEVAMTEVIKYKSPLQPQELEVKMPSAKTRYMVLLCLVPILTGGEPIYFAKDAGMRVVAVG